MPPPLIGGGIKRCCCLTSVCLTSVTYLGPKSKTERPRKTKIGTKVAHVTRDSDTTFKDSKGQRSRSPAALLIVLAGQHGHTVMVTYPYAYITYIVSPLADLGGGISWRLPADSLLNIKTVTLYRCTVVVFHLRNKTLTITTDAFYIYITLGCLYFVRYIAI